MGGYQNLILLNYFLGNPLYLFYNEFYGQEYFGITSYLLPITTPFDFKIIDPFLEPLPLLSKDVGQESSPRPGTPNSKITDVQRVWRIVRLILVVEIPKKDPRNKNNLHHNPKTEIIYLFSDQDWEKRHQGRFKKRNQGKHGPDTTYQILSSSPSLI